MDQIRDLFREHERSVGIDLCFGGLEEELADLPGGVAPPRGVLQLAVDGADAVGCVALKPAEDDGRCKMKRLYVRPAFRGRGIGRRLAVAAIEAARRIGYVRMRLGTLDVLYAAMQLYESLGFTRTGVHRVGPSVNVVLWELDLAPDELDEG
jgi:putative acetyltransferase